ncbi:hypothetical protein [Microbacterium sp. SSM24]|uniref:hypothetical protein n=1 Tax=Microbacterium sp. SSM24 TaxID=2991714 RepID=UPI002225E8D4|nr:hypothetical protein [Microbacterium sp. SSM24]MCW3493605.1 hypothetical protein [Microbacterium sp. SSM24]
MSEAPHGWFWTISHPMSHLLGTVTINAIILAAVVLSVSFPQWTWLFFVIAVIPATVWYVAMMRALKRNREGADGGADT